MKKSVVLLETKNMSYNGFCDTNLQVGKIYPLYLSLSISMSKLAAHQEGTTEQSSLNLLCKVVYYIFCKRLRPEFHQ